MTKKRILTLAACGLCLTGIVIGASAATVVQKVQSELRPDFTIVIDGKEQTFKDAQGNTVYPMLYDGTTYLPVRAIGEMMGKTVYWYEDEKKIELKAENSTVTDADVIVPSGSSGSTKPSLNTGLTPESNEVTLDEAKKIALEKAGLSASEVTFTESKPDYDDGRLVYDIEFCVGRTEYSAEILASDGTVISWDIDND